MTVYVDGMKNHGVRGYWCHMMADTHEELVVFADNLGLQRDWLHNAKIPHYDLTEWQRGRAVGAGAVEVSSRDIVQAFRNRL